MSKCEADGLVVVKHTAGDGFTVSHPGSPSGVHFRNYQGLFVANLSRDSQSFVQHARTVISNTVTNICCSVTSYNTVEHNKSQCSSRQQQDAVEARVFQRRMANPNNQVLKQTLNHMRNSPVTPKSVDVAKAIYGKDIASLKGKSTRAKPITVDPFLLTVTTPLGYIIVSQLVGSRSQLADVLFPAA
mmetsp:Transcript_22785/g.22994  ORF Transcript_22785/g.22994 Transcript_22785/m.22994 type:complete len:187 (-) Transcript_22785:779-1339(-)